MAALSLQEIEGSIQRYHAGRVRQHEQSFRLVATHPVLEGRRQYRVDPAHRQGGAARALRHGDVGSVIIGRRGDHVARRSLAFYQAIGEHLAGGIGGRS